MDGSSQLDIAKLLNAFYRRKGVIIACFLVVSSLTAYLAVTLPNVYQSSTLILITPQRLPTSYIRPTVTSSIQQRIHAITQQILSRTRLEKSIKEFSLYPTTSRRVTMEDRVEKMRANIRLDVRRNDAFQLSFDAETPEKAVKVTNRLASLFIEENLKIREQQAMGTTAFLNAETERIREELEKLEARVNKYKAQHRFELPDQVDVNLRTLAQLRVDLQSRMLRLASLRERKESLEKNLVEAATTVQDLKASGVSPEERQDGPHRPQIERRRTQLEALLTQFTERHPDIIRLRQEIQALETEGTGAPSTVVGSAERPVQQMLRKQIERLNFEINSLLSQNKNLRRQIAGYQARIDNTPLRGIELSKISRTYSITLQKYQDLLAKVLESQLSENMEKKQKGEQFQVLDPASFPEKPVSPNRPRLLLLGLLGGLAAGFGLAFMWENMDTSFKRGDEVDSYTDVPLLATIPAFITRRSVLEQRRAQGILVLASAAMLALGFVVIRFFVPSFLF